MRNDAASRVRAGWRAVVPVVALLFLAGAPTAVGARQATPAGTPTVPRAGECRVAPRAVPLSLPLPDAAAIPPVDPLATAAPFAPPAGEAADAETVAAVTATVTEALACRNAGDYPRAYALLSDRMLVELFGGAETLDPLVATALENPPRRVAPEERVGLVAVSDARLLEDGRVGAVVETAGGGETFVDYLFFVQSDGHLLVDGRVALDG